MPRGRERMRVPKGRGPWMARAIPPSPPKLKPPTATSVFRCAFKRPEFQPRSVDSSVPRATALPAMFGSFATVMRNPNPPSILGRGSASGNLHSSDRLRGFAKGAR